MHMWCREAPHVFLVFFVTAEAEGNYFSAVLNCFYLSTISTDWRGPCAPSFHHHTMPYPSSTGRQRNSYRHPHFTFTFNSVLLFPILEIVTMEKRIHTTMYDKKRCKYIVVCVVCVKKPSPNQINHFNCLKFNNNRDNKSANSFKSHSNIYLFIFYSYSFFQFGIILL